MNGPFCSIYAKQVMMLHSRRKLWSNRNEDVFRLMNWVLFGNINYWKNHWFLKSLAIVKQEFTLCSCRFIFCPGGTVFCLITTASSCGNMSSPVWGTTHRRWRTEPERAQKNSFYLKQKKWKIKWNWIKC